MSEEQAHQTTNQGQTAPAARITGGVLDEEDLSGGPEEPLVGALPNSQRVREAIRKTRRCHWCRWVGHESQECETPHSSGRRSACVVPPSHKHYQQLDQCPHSQYWNERRGGAGVPQAAQGQSEATEALQLPKVPKVKDLLTPPALPTPPPAIMTPPFRPSESPLTPLETTPVPETSPQTRVPSSSQNVFPADLPIGQVSQIPRLIPKWKGKRRASPRKNPYTSRRAKEMTQNEADELCRGASNVEDLGYNDGMD